VRTNAPHRHAHCAKRSRIKHGERSRRGPHVRRSRRRAGPRRADRREHAGPCCAVQRRGIKSLMGAVGSVGPAGVTLRFAIARRARGSCATVRELNLRPPPNASSAAPQYEFRDLEISQTRTVMLTRATRLRAKDGECSVSVRRMPGLNHGARSAQFCGKSVST
jgi:hypothetical protein